VLIMWVMTTIYLVWVLNQKSIQPLCFDRSIEMSDIVDGD